MGFSDFKKIIEKENRLYLVLVVWLLIGVVIINFLPIVGIIVFLPFLTFLLFLYLFSLVVKKNLTEYPLWKIVLFFIISLPLLAILSLILVVLFLFSIISYIFFTSWFILYGVFLIAINVDQQMRKTRYSGATRSFEFFGGFLIAFILLGGFLTGTILFTIYTGTSIFLSFVYLFVGLIIIIFSIVCLGYMFKKIFNAWLGIFFILIVFYTFFLTLKIFLGLTGSGSSSSFEFKIILLIFDLIILVYSIATIMGSQAELLAEKLKFFGVDTVLIWLLLSKAAFEFAANFPYEILLGLEIPWIGYVVAVGSELNLIKNIAVLGFFVLLLILIGGHEIRKFVKEEKKKNLEIEKTMKSLFKIDPTLKDSEKILEFRKTGNLAAFHKLLKEQGLLDKTMAKELEKEKPFETLDAYVEKPETIDEDIADKDEDVDSDEITTSEDVLDVENEVSEVKSESVESEGRLDEGETDTQTDKDKELDE